MADLFRVGDVDIDLDEVVDVETYLHHRGAFGPTPRTAFGYAPGGVKVPAAKVHYKSGGHDVVIDDDVRLLVDRWRGNLLKRGERKAA